MSDGWLDLFDAVIRGLLNGAVYGLVALPFVIVARSTQVFNFALAQLTAVGALVTIELVGNDVPFAVAMLVAGSLGAVAGLATDVVAIRPLRRHAVASSHGGHGTLVTTLAVGLIIETAAFLRWGDTATSIPRPAGAGSIRLFRDTYVNLWSVSLVGIAIVSAVGIWFFISRTTLGLQWRAMGDDPGLSALRGIPLKRLGTASVVVGSGLACIAGSLIASELPFEPYVGLVLALKVFLILAFVGMQSLAGAVIGGLALGVLEAALLLVMDAPAREVTVVILLVGILMVYPRGMLGGMATREV